MAFTSWTALRTSILDGLADGSVLTSSYGIHGRNHVFKSLYEVRSFLDFVEMQIAAESGDQTSLAQFTRPGDEW